MILSEKDGEDGGEEWGTCGRVKKGSVCVCEKMKRKV